MPFTEKSWLEMLEKAKKHLHSGETVKHWSSGTVESKMLGNDTKRSAVVLATSKRVIVFVPKMFGNYDIEEFPYSSMSSIEAGKGFLGGTAKFIASSNTMKVTTMQAGQPQQLIEFVRSQLHNPQVQTPQAASVDVMTQIEKLADLHSKGMLTAEEFAAAKAKVLA